MEFWKDELLLRLRRLFGNSRRRQEGPTIRDRMVIGMRRLLGKDVYLCHNCRWNWRSACNDPRWPNATWCREFKAR